MALTLSITANNYQAWKAQIAAQYGAVELKVEELKESKTPLRLPALTTARGQLFGANAAMRYLAKIRPETGLYGNGPFEEGLVDQWVDFSNNVLEPARNVWLWPVLELVVFNGQQYAAAKKEVGAALKILDEHLVANQFVVGHQVTIADIALATTLYDLFRIVAAPQWLKMFGSVIRWFNLVINQPQFEAVLGIAAAFEFAKNEKRAPKPVQPKKENKQQKKKKGQQQQQQQPKKKKAKNPLDLLPKSSMHLDTMKKLFFKAKPYNPEFFGQFWEAFDAAGYCFYEAKYQYNAENLIFWQVENSLRGFVQRSDACRRYAMGNMMIRGDSEETAPEGGYQLNGMWLFRGQEVPAEMSNNPDAEYYTWVKVDTSTDAGKARVTAYWTLEPVDGAKVLAREWFK